MMQPLVDPESLFFFFSSLSYGKETLTDQTPSDSRYWHHRWEAEEVVSMLVLEDSMVGDLRGRKGESFFRVNREVFRGRRIESLVAVGHLAKKKPKVVLSGAKCHPFPLGHKKAESTREIVRSLVHRAVHLSATTTLRQSFYSLLLYQQSCFRSPVSRKEVPF